MQINGTNALTGAQRIAPSNHTASVASSAPLAEGNANSLSVRDDININLRDTASMTATSHVQGPAAADGEVRMNLVNRIRAEIAAGTYETEEKLDIALSRLLDDIESIR